MKQSGLPPVEMSGSGEVVPPDTKIVADYQFHYNEFLSRDLAPEEADRLARAVVARDTTPNPKE